MGSQISGVKFNFYVKVGHPNEYIQLSDDYLVLISGHRRIILPIASTRVRTHYSQQ